MVLPFVPDKNPNVCPLCPQQLHVASEVLVRVQLSSILPPFCIMSAAQTQKETSETGWGCLEALGLSQKELVLAEALQMEYDALSRLKQDKAGTGNSQTPGSSKTPHPSTECPRPTPRQPSPAPTEGGLLLGLSGSNPSLNQLGGSQSPPPMPARTLPPQGSYIKESLYILDSSESTKLRDCSGSSLGNSFGSRLGFHPKGISPLLDDTPPAIPPRNPNLPSSGSENPFLSSRGSTMPRNVNLFMPDVDPPKVTSGDLNYDSINESLSQLNRSQEGPRGCRVNGDQSGKPVARSKTLPPQIPPRTYIPVPKSNKNQRRVSADPVRTEFIWSPWRPSPSCLYHMSASQHNNQTVWDTTTWLCLYSWRTSWFSDGEQVFIKNAFWRSQIHLIILCSDWLLCGWQVSLVSRTSGFGYELFQVSEERDEEVAAFCHMLDVWVRHTHTCTVSNVGLCCVLFVLDYSFSVLLLFLHLTAVFPHFIAGCVLHIHTATSRQMQALFGPRQWVWMSCIKVLESAWRWLSSVSTSENRSHSPVMVRHWPTDPMMMNIGRYWY